MWPFASAAEILGLGSSVLEPAIIRTQLERYSEYLKRDGTQVLPYHKDSLDRFYAQTHKQQLLSAAILDVAVHAHEQPIQADELTRSKRYLWRAFQRLGLSPTSDFFDRISDENIVEVYSMDHKQLYRNHKFFEYAPVTLEEIIGMDWVKQTERDAKISFPALKITVQMSLGLIKKTVDLSRAFPPHRARWKIRPDLPDLEVSLKWGSPLFKNGKIVAYTVTNICRLA